MIDHITIGVSDLERSREFYVQALAPLGYEEHRGSPLDEAKEIEFISGEQGDSVAISTAYTTGAPIHLAFTAYSEDQVAAFYGAGLAAGGRDNGGPGPRAQYSPGYYAAFVLDPDGHNIEAVFHHPVG